MNVKACDRNGWSEDARHIQARYRKSRLHIDSNMIILILKYTFSVVICVIYVINQLPRENFYQILIKIIRVRIASIKLSGGI